MKYFSFLLNLFLAATISYGGTIAGDENSSVETKDLTVHEKVTLYRPLVLDQDGFIAGLRYGEETNNIQSSIVLGNGAGINQNTKINDSIIIGIDAASSDNAKFKDTIIVGNNAGEGSKLESSIVIGNYAGFGIEGETNSVFIDTYTNEPALAYCGTNDAIYIHNGEVNLGRGEADESIVNRLRGKWEIEGLDLDGYIKKWPKNYYFHDNTYDFAQNQYYIGVDQDGMGGEWLDISSGGWINLYGRDWNKTGNSRNAIITLGGETANSRQFIYSKLAGIYLWTPDDYTTTINSLLLVDKGISLNEQIVNAWADLYSQSSWNLTTNNPKNYGNTEYYQTAKSSLPNGMFWWKGPLPNTTNKVLINSLTNAEIDAQSGSIRLESKKGNETGGLVVDGLNLNIDPQMNVTVGERYSGYYDDPEEGIIIDGTRVYRGGYPRGPYSVAIGNSLFEDFPPSTASTDLPENGANLIIEGRTGTTPARANLVINGSQLSIDIDSTHSGENFKVGDDVIIKTVDSSWNPSGKWSVGVTGTVSCIIIPSPVTSASAIPRGSTHPIKVGQIKEIDLGKNTRAFGASGDYSISIGLGCLADGDYAIASGKFSGAYGEASHAEGDNCFAYGEYAHAEGRHSRAIANWSHAEGDSCVASGTDSHAEGSHSQATASYSHADGDNCIANAPYSYAGGKFTTTKAADDRAWAWSGKADDNHIYESKGPGTFAIDPTDQIVQGDDGVDGLGTKGFFIGQYSLYDHIKRFGGGSGDASLEQLKQLMGTSGYNSSMNTLNSTIDNVNCMWNVLGQWCGYHQPLSSANKSTKIKDILFSDGSDEETDFVKRDIIINSIEVVNGGSGYTPSTTTITVDPADYYITQPEFTVTCENGVITKVTVDNTKCTMNFRTEKTLSDDIRLIVTGNGSGAQLSVNSKKEYPYPQAEYIGLKWGATKFINSGTDYPEGNLNIFGVSAELTGASCNKDENNNPVGDCMVWHVMVGDNGDALKSDITYDPLAGADSFTLMTWIKREDECETAARIIADLAGTRYGDGIELSLVSSATTPQIRVNPTNPGTRVGDGCQKIDGFTWPSGAAKTSWHHIAMVYKSSDNSVTWYFDGILKQTKYFTNNRGSVKENSYPLTLGNISGNNSDNSTFVGRMDDVRIFKNWTPTNTTLLDGRTKDIAYWMDKNDYYTTVPEIIDPIELGDMDKDVKVYSADQVDEIFNNQPVSGQVLTLGQLNKKTKIYTADQILSRQRGDSPVPSVMDIDTFSKSTSVTSYNIILENGPIQGFTQFEGIDNIELVLPFIKDTESENTLSIYIDSKSANGTKFSFSEENISKSCLPLDQQWEKNNENTIWKINWISPVFDNKWYYDGCDLFHTDVIK